MGEQRYTTRNQRCRKLLLTSCRPVHFSPASTFHLMDQKPNVWRFCTLQTHKHTHTQLHVHQVAAATKPLPLQIPGAQPFYAALMASHKVFFLWVKPRNPETPGDTPVAINRVRSEPLPLVRHHLPKHNPQRCYFRTNGAKQLHLATFFLPFSFLIN